VAGIEILGWRTPGSCGRLATENPPGGGKTMNADTSAFAYGPVPSRRLGKSLGINQIPAKVCTYACVYCQVGRTTQLTVDRRCFFDPQAIVRAVQERIAKAQAAAEKIDYLTFVPDGEPTLDLHLGREVALLKAQGLPVGVITNASLIWRDDVRDALGQADWVSLKIDSVVEAVWRRVNRPHQTLRLASILDGMLQFAQNFTGTLVTETMLVKGLNDQDSGTAALAGFLARLRPHAAYLSVPTRPPALKGVRGPDAAALNRTYQALAEKVERVEFIIGYEGNAFAFTGDVEHDLLGIAAVHPMRQEAVRVLLDRAGASWTVVDRLVAQGDLVETHHEGHRYYLRKFDAALGPKKPLRQGH
jgi:wyosine [tRNA(Phe)-imidazoG37] synthetase (radical SAM superfamily)